MSVHILYTVHQKIEVYYDTWTYRESVISKFLRLHRKFQVLKVSKVNEYGLRTKLYEYGLRTKVYEYGLGTIVYEYGLRTKVYEYGLRAKVNEYGLRT